MVLKRDLGRLLSWTCGCGVRLLASDEVEMERLRRQHGEIHLGENEWGPA